MSLTVTITESNVSNVNCVVVVSKMNFILSLVMCLWMTMPHVINLRQQFGGFLSVSKLLASTVYICVCVYHSTYVTFPLWPLARAS